MSVSRTYHLLLFFTHVTYLFALTSIFFYSFTQVDLNLTLTKISIWYALQDYFQHIGYFQRPLSAYWYLGTIFLLTVGYIGYLVLSWKGYLKKSHLIVITLITAGTLFITYPAFSYDIFNYMFDARIVTRYHENPYVHKALDYPADPWILFMRWTHRTYPYGPFWLALSIPLSYLGMGKLLVTLLLFKAISVMSYLASGFIIYKIVRVVDERSAILGSVVFLLNPLVLIEMIISAHNDSVMMFIALLAFYMLIKKHGIYSILFLILSISIKFATIFILPAFVWGIVRMSRKITINWDRVFLVSSLCMVVGIVAASWRTQFQPWYLLYVIPLVSLIPRKILVLIPMITLSLTSLLLYVPFIYYGNWDSPVPFQLNMILVFGCVIAFLYIGIKLLYERVKAKDF